MRLPSLWRLVRSLPATQGEVSNHKKSPVEKDQQAFNRVGLGHSGGGLTSKIDLAAHDRCRPLVVLTSEGQRHDSLAFKAVMATIKCRGWVGVPVPGANQIGCWPIALTAPAETAPGWPVEASRRRSQSRPIKLAPDSARAVPVAAPRTSTPSAIATATPSNGPSITSARPAPSAPATTNATTASAAPSPSQ